MLRYRIMWERPGALLVGSSSRRAGKTAFLARIIAREARRRDVTAVKVTPLPEPEAPLAVTEERLPSGANDTGRFLLAGAKRALWIRSGRSRLDEAAALIEREALPGSCLVVEGGSLRRALKPGLFLMLRREGCADEKKSYRDLLPDADRAVAFNGRDWDCPPESCRFVDGAWILRPPASALVLAGGESRRMGLDKALLEVEGRPLIAHIVERLEDLFDDVVIGAGRSEDYGFLGRPVAADREPGQGPLMGIAAGLARIGHDLALVMACDTPFPDLRFAASLLDQAEGHDLVIPRSRDGVFEPLFAVYRRSAAPAAEALLAAGRRSILGLLDTLRVRVVPLPETVRLANINTLDDYLALGRRRT